MTENNQDPNLATSSVKQCIGTTAACLDAIRIALLVLIGLVTE